MAKVFSVLSAAVNVFEEDLSLHILAVLQSGGCTRDDEKDASSRTVGGGGGFGGSLPRRSKVSVLVLV